MITPVDSIYEITADTVTDQNTGLVWQRNVPSGSYTWANAKSYCAELTLGGLTDWRLPTRIELLSIVDETRGSPAINPNAFPGTPSADFWSSTPQARSTNGAWYVSFGTGGAEFFEDLATDRVRCVR